MNAERKSVLEMLAEGKITADDAERLLDKMSGSPIDEGSPKEGTVEGAAHSAKKPRFLRIMVEKPGQDHVNIRIPLSFMRTGTHLAVLPSKVRERLADYGINLPAFGAMTEEELALAIENIDVDIDKGHGKKVRMYCE